MVIGDLCNGSTPDSDSVCGGSNPSSPATPRLIRTREYLFPEWNHRIPIAQISQSPSKPEGLFFWPNEILHTILHFL